MEGHLVFDDGFAFKDLNRNGKLDPYEDWRLPLEERIADLVRRLSVEEIAGLMLHSMHQAVCRNDPFAAAFNNGIVPPDTRKNTWDLTEKQQKLLRDEHLRTFLLVMVENAETAARWNNALQVFAENLPLGIPVGISSDPRHSAFSGAEFDMGAGTTSVWPAETGLAAAFDPALVKAFGKVAAQEYRALGITTALSPQIDLATEPRWFRFINSFGEDARLETDLMRAYCDGFQTSENDAAITWSGLALSGWGFNSVNAMVKHWPGGCCVESGRDAHYGYGKYGVYPAGNFTEQLKVFLEGAFKLDDGTKCAAAVMPHYMIPWNQDTRYGENVGCSYSKYIITDLLRNTYGFDDLVCTDWGITGDAGPMDVAIAPKCWGVEKLSIAERHYKILEAGVDQFGGCMEKAPVLEAYKMGVAEHGETAYRKRFEESAARILRNMFRVGLFENPYVDPEHSKKTLAAPEFVSAGFAAQVRSVIMLKNSNPVTGKAVLPLTQKTRVYIPPRRIPETKGWFGETTPAHEEMPFKKELVNEYFEWTDDPAQVDAAICWIESPKSICWREEEGYFPFSLQYRPYTATHARQKNIAGNDDRSYFGKTNKTENECQLDDILATKKKMGDKPVIVIVETSNPFVAAEFEGAASAVLLDFRVQPRALLELLSGKREPSALLPFQMPQDMETVETQAEDKGRDMKPYRDSAGNTWDFAFGLNWSGVIDDSRVKTYR